MEKSLDEIIHNLSKYVGCEMLRKFPTAGGEWSFICHPFTFGGFTQNCELMSKSGYILPVAFTDENWITLEEVMTPKGNELNKWLGKKIQRIHYANYRLGPDYSFICEPMTLVSATKHHVVLTRDNGNELILPYPFALSKDWALAE